MIKTLILIRLFGDMSNMLLVKINNFEERVKLTSEMTWQTFKIKQTQA
jgi:hypothetical protein